MQKIKRGVLFKVLKKTSAQFVPKSKSVGEFLPLFYGVASNLGSRTIRLKIFYLLFLYIVYGGQNLVHLYQTKDRSLVEIL